MRLRIYLILLVIAALLPVVIFSTISLNKLQEAHQTAALNSIRETARATSLMVDRELNGVRSALRVLATSDALAGEDFKHFYDQAKIANLAAEGWVILYDENGGQIINTRLPYGAILPKRVTDTDNFMEIKNSNKIQVSGLHWGPSVKRHVILVDLPVKIGTKTYVLSQAFPVHYFNSAFKDRGIPASWIVAIFDKDGSTLARSHGAQEFVGKKANQDTINAIQGAYAGVLRHTIRGGIEVYDVFTRSSMSNWTIAIGAPAKEIDSAIDQAVWITASGLLTAILLASGVAWIVGFRILRSVNGAVHAASALGMGRPMPVIPVSGVKEINELHAALVRTDQALSQEKTHRQAAEAERNKLLASEQKARKFAEDQNQAKDRFLAMLGHELRNPLAAIISAIDIVHIGRDAAIRDRALEIIGRQGGHLNRIVNDLLDVSRVLSGKVLLNKQQLDLTSVAGDCLSTLHSTGRTHGYSVTFSGGQPAWVDADATRIEQLINNLLDNAVKYTPLGEKIHVDVRADGHEAVLKVRDTGIGIPAELLPNIFDVFVQGERSLDRAQGGLGIGLSLVRQLAELHGGSMEVESEGVGRGSTFTLRLPCAAVHALDQPVKLGAGADKTCSVLLIDDHDDAREMTACMLEKHGHKVMTASNGLEGVKVAAATQPDIALIDIGLPDINGYEIARLMRANKELEHVKLIALTGYGTQEDQQRSLEAGFDMHLIKPLSIDRFTKAIDELCKK